MKTQTKNALLRYGITGLIALMTAYGVAEARGFAWQQAANLQARYLSDGFFAAGLILTGLGALVWISTTGFFDIFGYGFKSLLVLFSALRRPEEHQHYYDYKQEKDAKRGKPLYFLLLVGLIFVAISVIFLALYYNLPA